MTELSVCENCRRIGCTGYDEGKGGSCPAYLPQFQGVAISTCEQCGGRMRVDRSLWVCKKCAFQRHVLIAPKRELPRSSNYDLQRSTEKFIGKCKCGFKIKENDLTRFDSLCPICRLDWMIKGFNGKKEMNVDG